MCMLSILYSAVINLSLSSSCPSTFWEKKVKMKSEKKKRNTCKESGKKGKEKKSEKRRSKKKKDEKRQPLVPLTCTCC